MYNESRKQRYIEKREKEVVLPNNYLVAQFEKVAPFEEEKNKDVSNFTTYEIIEYYKMVNSSSLESLFVLNSQFSMYTQWCMEQNLVKDNQNHFLEVSKDVLIQCVNKIAIDKRIISREKVLEWCEELPNPKDQFILLSLFEYGKSKQFEDIINVKITDIDGNTMKLSNRTVQISDMLRKYAEESYETKIYYSISGKEKKTMPLVGYNDRIVKNYPNIKSEVTPAQESRRIYNSIQRIFDYMGVKDWCSANSISESGKMHMIKTRAAELGMSNYDYIYSPHIKEVETQFDCKIVRSVYVTKYKDYL